MFHINENFSVMSEAHNMNATTAGVGIFHHDYKHTELDSVVTELVTKTSTKVYVSATVSSYSTSFTTKVAATVVITKSGKTTVVTKTGMHHSASTPKASVSVSISHHPITVMTTATKTVPNMFATTTAVSGSKKGAPKHLYLGGIVAAVVCFFSVIL